jgi:DNA-binding transcriptional LysR family regulator
MNDPGMDPRRLELLLELSRLGSMREVGESMHVTTSTVSQQIAVLAQEAGTPLTEPHGRRVRLTPAGQRLAGHAVTILAAIEAARLDLDPTGAPTGTVRVAAFATAVRESILPVVRLLAERHPAVLLVIHEHEPDEALGLLADDAVDLALTYDYNLAPARFDRSLATRPLGLRQWGLGTPTAQARVAGTTLEVFRRFADQDWIVNSRNSGDEEVIRIVASLADFQPRITHRVDSLELVQDMILAGLGVGLLPAGRPVRRGVALRTLGQPAVTQRPFAVTRLGRSAWPPLALVLQLLGEISGLTALIAGLLAHRRNGFFVFKDGYEYVLVLAVISLALAALGPGRWSVDAAAGIGVTGWAGAGIALGVALAGTAGLLAAFWRPRAETTNVPEAAPSPWHRAG